VIFIRHHTNTVFTETLRELFDHRCLSCAMTDPQICIFSFSSWSTHQEDGNEKHGRPYFIRCFRNYNSTNFQNLIKTTNKMGTCIKYFQMRDICHRSFWSPEQAFSSVNDTTNMSIDFRLNCSSNYQGKDTSAVCQEVPYLPPQATNFLSLTNTTIKPVTYINNLKCMTFISPPSCNGKHCYHLTTSQICRLT